MEERPTPKFWKLSPKHLLSRTTAFDQFMMWLPAPAGDEAGMLTVQVGGQAVAESTAQTLGRVE